MTRRAGPSPERHHNRLSLSLGFITRYHLIEDLLTNRTAEPGRAVGWFTSATWVEGYKTVFCFFTTLGGTITGPREQRAYWLAPLSTATTAMMISRMGPKWHGGGSKKTLGPKGLLHYTGPSSRLSSRCVHGGWWYRTEPRDPRNRCGSCHVPRCVSGAPTNPRRSSNLDWSLLPPRWILQPRSSVGWCCRHKG